MSRQEYYNLKISTERHQHIAYIAEKLGLDHTEKWSKTVGKVIDFTFRTVRYISLDDIVFMAEIARKIVDSPNVWGNLSLSHADLERLRGIKDLSSNYKE